MSPARHHGILDDLEECIATVMPSDPTQFRLGWITASIVVMGYVIGAVDLGLEAPAIADRFIAERSICLKALGLRGKERVQ